MLFWLTSQSHAATCPPPAAQCNAPLPYESTAVCGSNPCRESAVIIPATSPSAAARRPGSCRCESFDFFSRHGPGRPFPLPRHELLSAAVPKFVSIAETSRASSSSRPAAIKASSSVM